MKKWGNLAAVLILVALLLWAGSRFSTGMVRLMALLDSFAGDEVTRFVDEDLDAVPTLPPETLELTDQDYDSLDIPADAVEEIRPRSTDYLSDGDVMERVDETIEELAQESAGH